MRGKRNCTIPRQCHSHTILTQNDVLTGIFFRSDHCMSDGQVELMFVQRAASTLDSASMIPRIAPILFHNGCQMMEFLLSACTSENLTITNACPLYNSSKLWKLTTPQLKPKSSSKTTGLGLRLYTRLLMNAVLWFQETSFKVMASTPKYKVYQKMVKKYKAKCATLYFNDGTKVRLYLSCDLLEGEFWICTP